MCDRCGTIFSEREDGWSTFQGSTVRRSVEGRQIATTDQIDTCSACTIGAGATPRLAIDDRIAKTQTQAERDTVLKRSER
jgi:hypothetical protein